MPTDEHDKKLTKLLWRGVTIALVFGVAAGILIGLIANGNAKRAVNCVNDSLASRNAPTSRDAHAHIADAEALQAFLRAIASPDATAREKAFVTFTHAQDRYVAVLIHDQKIRDMQPLGRC